MPSSKLTNTDTSFWIWHNPRKEWICIHGVGHYDPKFVKDTTHGCDGCCTRSDFPGILVHEEEDK